MGTELQRLVDENACQKLITEYFHNVDFGNSDAIPELFMPDGRLSGPGIEIVGRDEIRAFLSKSQSIQRRQSRHLCTNIVIQVDGDQATSHCYLLNFRHDSQTGIAESPAPSGLPKFVGEYHDRFSRTDQGWKFASRHFEVAFIRS